MYKHNELENKYFIKDADINIVAIGLFIFIIIYLFRLHKH